MSDIVMKVENLSKLYRLGLVGSETLRDDVLRWWANVRGKEDPFAKIGEVNVRAQAGDSDYVWALKDINFEVKQGEVLGIIGKNGAGKSTLLKLLSKVTGPTTGMIKMKGRAASLLEVGTGFHPELTGKENVFLNGAILGMRKKEVAQKLDEIVSFAAVEKFIDTPVKRYSSGMYVRLAFAVAAFLEPEILIVDEVLAVGDAEFQKKCMGKLKNVSEGGRTVLFVSHNMSAVSSLCTRSIVLTDGMMSFEGDTESALNHYLESEEHSIGFTNLENRKSTLWAQPKSFSRLISFETLDKDYSRIGRFKMGQPLIVRIKLEITNYIKGIEVGIFVYGRRQKLVGLASNVAEGFTNIKKGIQEIEIEIPNLYLLPGEHTLGVWIQHNRKVDDACENALDINVMSDSFTGHFLDYDRFKGYGSLIRSNWKAL